MDENPGEAGGDEHSEEDEGKHEAPGGPIMLGWRGCLRDAIFCGIGHVISVRVGYRSGICGMNRTGAVLKQARVTEERLATQIL
jgi:hypothetical protein